LAYSWTRKMEILRSSETSVTYWTTLRYFLESSNLQM
jgi:hypothetical protein